MSPLFFVGMIVFAIFLLVFLTVRFKIHPFIVLFLVAMLMALFSGYDAVQAVEKIKEYFGTTLGSIGILIVFGAIIATAINDTGAATSIANFFIRLFRGKRLELAPALTGFIMSIPVFGDIAIVLNAPISAVLAKRRKMSMTVMAPITNVGLTLTHGLVPPSPGILAVAVLLQADIGMTILLGLACATVSFAVTWLVAKPFLARGEYIEPLADFTEGIEPVADDAPVDELLIAGDRVPHPAAAFAPLLLPVLMIGIGSVSRLFVEEGSVAYQVLSVIGDSIIALFCGILVAVVVAMSRKKALVPRAVRAGHPEITDKTPFLEIVGDNWVTRALKISVVPLLVTAMGGAMGGLLRENPAINEIGEAVVATGFPKLLIPFLLAAILMAVCGSMTVAAITAAALVQPLLGILELSPEVATIAIGAGSMVFWHVNNSGFWLFSSLYNFTTKQGLKYFTTVNALGGAFAFGALALLVLIGLA